MTSGQFTSFPIEQITVDREARQRRELTGIDELALSIKEVGLINPLVIERNGNLRAGERRFTAVKTLGWTHVSVQFIDELDEASLQLLELEENIKRVNLDWQDECAAIERYHQLRSAADETWTMEKSADQLGLSRKTLYTKLGVAKEISGGNARVAEATKYSVARGITERASQRRKDSALDTVTSIVITGKAPSDDEPEEKEAPIQNDDFIQWQETYVGEKFNFIHCDFPYGISADKHDQGAAASFGGYEDSPELYWNLIKALEKGMENVVAESAHLMFWFSMDYYADTLSRLNEMGWKVDPFPLIWHKSDNSGILPDPSRGPRRIYETCFFGSRGDRKIVRAVSNLASQPNIKILHMSEKNRDMLTKFMGMFVDEYSIVLDPTCGSGNALKAALSSGAVRVLGLELNSEFVAIAKEHFFDEEG